MLHGRAWSGPKFLVGSAPTCKLVGMDRSPVAVAFAASTGTLDQKAGVTLEPFGPGPRYAVLHVVLNNESDTSSILGDVGWARGEKKQTRHAGPRCRRGSADSIKYIHTRTYRGHYGQGHLGFETEGGSGLRACNKCDDVSGHARTRPRYGILVSPTAPDVESSRTATMEIARP